MLHFLPGGGGHLAGCKAAGRVLCCPVAEAPGGETESQGSLRNVQGPGGKRERGISTPTQKMGTAEPKGTQVLLRSRGGGTRQPSRQTEFRNDSWQG